MLLSTVLISPSPRTTALPLPPPAQVHRPPKRHLQGTSLLFHHLTFAEDNDAAAADGAGAAVKRQRLEGALAGSDVASAYPDTSVQFDAAPALDHGSAVAAIAEAYAPASRDKAAAEQEKREAAAAAAKAAQAAAAAKRQREAAINQV